ncbi:hypothetical protein CNR37_00045 [Pseudomonas phage ventosus]|uniref:Uncharacterized protein n=1 Tax=Pseudomonas phage ventosus TaxID=2048980 RepID=A0A2H4P7U6_9CAUD|nr:hypothetical protein CNR37_00045 [Pseudomonas phage ventosus]
MTKSVYVVTGLELGWDCVCGVHESFDGALRSIFEEDCEGKSTDELEDRYNNEDTGYIIHEKRLRA